MTSDHLGSNLTATFQLLLLVLTCLGNIQVKLKYIETLADIILFDLYGLRVKVAHVYSNALQLKAHN